MVIVDVTTQREAHHPYVETRSTFGCQTSTYNGQVTDSENFIPINQKAQESFIKSCDESDRTVREADYCSEDCQAANCTKNQDCDVIIDSELDVDGSDDIDCDIDTEEEYPDDRRCENGTVSPDAGMMVAAGSSLR